MLGFVNDIAKGISLNSQNIPGRKVKRRLLIIESDDWGAIRMPSTQSYRNLLDYGIPVDTNPFNRLDSLETAEDLEALYDTLKSFRDPHENRLKITANTLVANPDFDRIRQSGFTEYFFETRRDTYRRLQGSTATHDAVIHGLNQGIFIPQLHGREHVHVNAWLEALRNNDEETRRAFDNEVWGHPTKYFGDKKMNFSSALHIRCKDDEAFIIQSLNQAVRIFKQDFGFLSESFIAPRYIWNEKIEHTLIEKGVRYLQGLMVQRIPKREQLARKMNFQGSVNKYGQRYLVRNVFFEPAVNPSFPWIKDALKRVSTAFYWNKPAVICSHRINYVGGLDEKNRKNNLSLLRTLITEIQKQFPDVLFLSTPEAGKEMEYGE